MDPCFAEAEREAISCLLDCCIDEVHLRRSDKSCHEEIVRIIIQILRCVILLYNTVLHDTYPVSHCHGFSLVMSYIYKCSSQLLVQFADLAPHLCSELGIEI